MTASSLASLPPADFLDVALDADNTPFYPHFLASPDAISKIPGSLRDTITATNMAYLARRLLILESGGTDLPTETAPAPPELVELGAKAEELAAQGIHLGPRRLRALAEAHRLPVLKTKDRGGLTAHIMSGSDWAHLARHIASPPSN